MNSTAPTHWNALVQAKKSGKPIAWWTIEDPNHFSTFLRQAALADFVFTSDESCISTYQLRLGHNRVFWLPLACCPEIHVPMPREQEATDLVLSANWYDNEARAWSAATVIDPLLGLGKSLTLFSYNGNLRSWPPKYRPFWRGERHYLTASDQYRAGHVALGILNQRTGLDGRGKTVMTSMRTFEALACGKPLLVGASDAFERLGMRNWEHLVWVTTPEETVKSIDRLLSKEGEEIATRGRDYVVNNHTYRHRIDQIRTIVTG